MADAKEQFKDFWSQWEEFQRGFFTQWTTSFGKMAQPWAEAMKYGQGMKTPFAAPDLFTKWNDMIRETLGRTAGLFSGGIGPTVLSRIMNASNVFVVFNQFWTEIVKDIPELSRAKGDDAKSREIFERWVARYGKVFEQLIGSPPSDAAEEMMTSWLNIVQMHQAALGLMWNPWIQAMPQWREQAESFMRGDWTAISKGRSLWREVYDDTLGRILRMPAFGLTKEQTEKLRRTYDAFARYWYSLPGFYQFFYDTGVEALKQAFVKVQNMKLEEMKPETLREIYGIWWTTNENVFFELFKKPEFGNAMAEVLHCGLRFKKRLDELTAEFCSAMSIPTDKDFDEVARTVQALRRKLRKQEKAIEELRRKLDERS